MNNWMNNSWTKKLVELSYEHRNARIRTKAQFSEFAAKYGFKANTKKTLDEMYIELECWITAKEITERIRLSRGL